MFMVHSRPRTTRLYLVGSAALLSLVLLLGAAVVLYTSSGEDPTKNQAAGTPQAETTSEAPSASRLCERSATQALSRLAIYLRSGGTADQALMEERQQLDPAAYAAFSGVVNEFMMADSVGQQNGIAAQITTVIPTVRKICAQAA